MRQQAAQSKLLTAEEEVELALTVQEGLRAAEEIASVGKSGKGAAELEEMIRAGGLQREGS